MNCPDCKDGYYYPFVGPREKCQTCNEVPKMIEQSQSVNIYKERIQEYKQKLHEINESREPHKIHNLIPEFQERFNAGKLTLASAKHMAQLSPEAQKKTLQKMTWMRPSTEEDRSTKTHGLIPEIVQLVNEGQLKPLHASEIRKNPPEEQREWFKRHQAEQIKLFRHRMFCLIRKAVETGDAAQAIKQAARLLDDFKISNKPRPQPRRIL